MAVYDYIAIPAGGGSASLRQKGRVEGKSSSEVRASLRDTGLQVIHLRPRRSLSVRDGFVSRTLDALRKRWNDHLRTRRTRVTSEFFDAISNMLEAGLPLLEAVSAALESSEQSRSARQRMMIDVQARLRDGSSLSESLAAQPAWFSRVEVAMIDAASRSGQLSSTLRQLSERHARGDDIRQKIVSALAYPFIVFLVGIGVVIFLSTKTLPDLVGMLSDAGISEPTLTVLVMSVGQFLSRWMWLLLVVVVVLPIVAPVGVRLVLRRIELGGRWRERIDRLHPRFFRRLAVARVSEQIADLAASGVPVVEAIRIASDSAGSMSLQRALQDAAGRVEGGEQLEDALDRPLWFDAEYRRLLATAQQTGALDSLLHRISKRYSRQAERLIDRLAALLEPIVILLLAIMVGTVVMAAVLPLVRLQELLR